MEPSDMQGQVNPFTPIEGLVSVAVSPPDAALIVKGTTPASQNYQATGTFRDGHTEDLTGRAMFSSRDVTLGSFAGNVYTTSVERGGFATVLATAGGLTGMTSVSVHLERAEIDPRSASLPADPASRFSGMIDAARKPSLVYPNDGVLLPPNLRRLEFHFLPGAGNTLFELSLQNKFTDVKVYLDCNTPLNGGCIYTISPSVWRWIADTNRGGQPIAITLKGTGASAGSTVGVSSPVALSFSLDDLQGGIYYWTTSNTSAIMRYDFASTTMNAAEKFVGTEATNGNCVGCHALSHNGNKLVAATGTPQRGELLLMDVGRARPLVPWGSVATRSLFESWSPDDSRFVGVWGELDAKQFNLLLFDGATGAMTGIIDVGATFDRRVAHPDWSPDGKRIAYTRIGDPRGSVGQQRIQEEYRGAIEVVTQDGAGWSQPSVLVPHQAGKNHYYPSFAPDSSFLVYNESTCPGGANGVDCDSDSDPSARLWAIALAPGARPVELTHANAPGIADGKSTDLTTSYARWSPFVFVHSAEFGGKLNWISFSSRRQFGLRSPPPSVDNNGYTGTLLWLSAVDPSKVAEGSDPSYPPFAVPFQDLNTSNHLAQWTTRVVPMIQ